MLEVVKGGEELEVAEVVGEEFTEDSAVFRGNVVADNSKVERLRRSEAAPRRCFGKVRREGKWLVVDDNDLPLSR